ncbi:MAG: hypothetical protein KDD61_10295 [Bdellovibrionales bacterium]|nr:hypothetical protein [Bdellovibrionales bacterium]
MRAFDPTKLPLPLGDFQEVTKKALSYPYLDIEIGCGVGRHPLMYSNNNPDRLLIAIERTKEKFRKFSNSLAINPQDNLAAVHADAVNWISHYIHEDQVDRYFILYPNPYPKSRQANLRWANMPFVQHLIRTLRSKGTIELATNLPEYANEVVESWCQFPQLELIGHSEIAKGISPRTHFEEKYLERGDLCQSVIFQKTQHSD